MQEHLVNFASSFHPGTCRPPGGQSAARLLFDACISLLKSRPNGWSRRRPDFSISEAAEGRGADGGRYVYTCDLANVLTPQLHFSWPPPTASPPHTPKAEITSASYGNCLVYLLSNCPTQREDACLLKGTELDVAVSPPLSWRPRPELKPSAATSPNSNLCQQDVCLFSKQAEKCV